MRHIVTIGVVCLLFAAATQAQRVYRWIDENGQVQYTQTPPPERPANTETIDINGRTKADPECCNQVREFSVLLARALNRGLPLSEVYNQYPAHTYPHVVEVSNFISSRATGNMDPVTVGNLTRNACNNGTFRACRLSDAGSSSAPRTRADSSGTAFQIAPNLVLTNHHVIDGCTSLTVGSEAHAASVVASDSSADLALLNVPIRGSVIPRLRDNTQVVLGESITVAGFPLGSMLGSLNVTTGAVSAEGGPRGQTQLFQMTAPIQPGSSGGPVLDERGQLIGVVVSKMNDNYAMRASGSVPQNVNFAIKPSVVARFLDRQNVSYGRSNASEAVPTSTVAADAKRFTYPVHCQR